jgi:L-ascorbate metabolism protein UlaG (beta-lactamase superfamily)
MAGFLINSRGTTLMVDSLLEGFDMPIMIDMPIAATDVPELDAILVTHSDNDHYGVPTCRALAPVTRAYHSTGYAASLMQDERWPAHGHAIGDALDIGPVHVELTPADHAWQNASRGASDRVFQPEDACGFWIERLTAPSGRRVTPA